MILSFELHPVLNEKGEFFNGFNDFFHSKRLKIQGYNESNLINRDHSVCKF